MARPAKHKDAETTEASILEVLAPSDAVKRIMQIIPGSCKKHADCWGDATMPAHHASHRPTAWPSARLSLLYKVHELSSTARD
eukprot:9467308-Pyramimonas_sp.AAC.1